MIYFLALGISTQATFNSAHRSIRSTHLMLMYRETSIAKSLKEENCWLKQFWSTQCFTIWSIKQFNSITRKELVNQIKLKG